MPFQSVLIRFAAFWTKICLTLIFLGWLGLEALDRVYPRTTSSAAAAESSSSQPVSAVQAADGASKAVAPKAAEVPAQDEPVAHTANSTWGALLGEAWSSISHLSEKTLIQLGFAVVVGAALGLVTRPGVNHLARWKRVQDARRRDRRFQQDQMILAEGNERVRSDAPIATPNPSVSPLEPKATAPVRAPLA